MFTKTKKSIMSSPVLLAGALAAVIMTAAPSPAHAGRTGSFFGGLAAGTAGVLLFSALSAPRNYDRGYYGYDRDYYYAPAASCPSVKSILRKLTNSGYYDFRNEKHGSRYIRVIAHKRGSNYKLKLDSCSGRLLSKRRI